METLLLIDNNKDDLISYAEHFQSLLPHLNVLTSDSGEQGIQTAIHERPDVILLDLQMPVMDGFEACKKLKSQDSTKHIPIIILTAVHTDTQSKTLALNLGADAFLTKPVYEEELIAQVKAMLRIKKAEDKLRKEKDILALRLHEKTETLKKNEEILLKFMQSATDGFGVFDSKLTLLESNDRGLELLGLEREKSIGKTMAQLSPDVKKTDLYHVYHEVIRTGKPVSLEDVRLGPQFPERFMRLKVFKVGEGLGIIMTDVTEERNKRHELEKSLKEKEVLLKEVHHRVKNNFQVIISLMNIQSRNTNDDELKHILSNIKNRLHAMSLIHQNLYQSNLFAEIQFDQYLDMLSKHLIRQHANSAEIEFEFELEKLKIGLNQAIPCGLIINELVDNAIKHAFKGKEQKRICLRLKRDHDNLSLTVSDNGFGLPDTVFEHQHATVGMYLVNILTQQLDGALNISRENGTTFTLLFKEHAAVETTVE